MLHQLQLSVRDAISTSREYLNEYRNVPQVERRLDRHLQMSALLALALKHGGKSEQVAAASAKAELSLDAGNVPLADHRIDDILSALENLKAAALSIQATHRKLAALSFFFDTSQYDITDFLHLLSVDLMQWSADLADAAKYDLPFRGHRDPNTSLFVRWYSEFRHDDAQLAAALHRYAQLERQMFNMVDVVEQQTGGARLAAYERGYERYIKNAQKELRRLILAYTPILKQLGSQEQQAVARIETAADRIDSYVEELVAAQHTSSEEARRKIGDAEYEARRLLLAIVALSILLAIGGGLYLANNIVKPLVQMTAVIDRLSADDIADSTGFAPSRDDEIGDMQKALIRFRETAIERGRRLANLAEMERERLQAAVANMPQGLCMFDRQERLIISNARYAEIYGIGPEKIRPGMALTEILELRLAAGAYHGDPATYLSRRNSTGRGSEAFDVILELANGRIVQVAKQPLKDGGWVGTHEDITERRLAEARIHHMARHDALTDLPNRSFLKESLAEGLKRVRRGDTMAVLCMDLDRFKAVNDTLGHPIGDQLLQVVAERIRACIRETDTAARFGGDEFAVLQLGAHQPQGATVLASRLVETLGAPYAIGDHQLVIGCSVGIAMAPSDGEDAEDLLKNADLALYRAKLDGRGLYRFFEPEMDAQVQARRLLELDLRGALANKEFALHYQPLIDVETREVNGLEALLRWTHPKRGSVSPAEFIPLAEETGLIVSIGEWVIRQACKDAVAWPEHVQVAVNISPVQFKNASLVPVILSALASAGLAANRLELEITESVLLQDTDATLAVLHQLRALGVHVSMDDFGTGYSSLSYLRSFPFDKIKIDQSFVRDMIGNKQSLAIIQAVTSLGATLGMATTAEGVETRDQLTQLQAHGCTEVQGYYFSKPKPVEEIARLYFPHADGVEQDRIANENPARRSG
jgi:diguanylate cyclase (GGDEF)-like protein